MSFSPFVSPRRPTWLPSGEVDRKRRMLCLLDLLQADLVHCFVCERGPYARPPVKGVLPVEDISNQNRGYDLLATKKKSGTDEELHVEVKGTSTGIQRFFISRREKLYMSESRWRLLIVTDALTTEPRVSLLTSREVEEKFKFNEFAWEVVLK